MADQLTDLVKRMQAEGVPEADIVSFIQQFDRPAPSHEPPNTFDVDTEQAARKATGIESGSGTLVAPGGGRGTRLDVRKSNRWARENAPAIGAALATAPVTGGWSIPAAIAGGAGGATLRGDDPGTALWEGAKQGLMQGAPKIIEGLSRVAYKTGIPQSVLQKFRGVDVAGAGLENRAVLGTTRGVEAAQRGGARAVQQADAAADTVPSMFDTDIRAAFQPRIARAQAASRPGTVSEIADYLKASTDEIGPFPMRGQEQLARRAELAPDAATAARNTMAANAASNPAFANIERRAINQNLRRSEPMARALDAQQANKGLLEAAKAQEFSTPLSRLRTVGVKDAMFLPTVSSGLGIAGHELSKADPTMVRALLSLLSTRSNEQ